MRKIVGSLAYVGYLLVAAGLGYAGPRVGFAPFGSFCFALALASACIAAHLVVLSGRRASTLTRLLDCQDELLRQIVERLDRADMRADAAEARLSGLGDVRATLQDVAAMLAVRAAGPRPSLVRAA